MDEKMDELYPKCCQQMLFCGKLNKINKVETIYVGFFQNKSTNEMFKSQFKAILHISLI
jgi:uncharacterized alpha/beta hydrolase family protein